MMIRDKLTKIVSAAFAACGCDAGLGAVSASDRLDLCQFQCNGAFAAAKRYKKAPMAIAAEVAAIVAEHSAIGSAEAVPPGFINLTVTDECLLEELAALAGDPHLGVPQADKPETIVLDYGGPNVAKPLHIGHLRPAVIGEALKRIARATGRTVVADVHFGDWGLPIGLIFAELRERHPEWPCFGADFDPASGEVPTLEADLLNEVYPLASARSKEDKSFLEAARGITFELQNGHPGYTALWREVMRVSKEDVRRVYERLGVDFDVWYGESDAHPYIEPMVETLTEKGLLVESDGAMVVEVEEETDKAPMPPIIVVKTDKSYAYATTDLATICQRQKDFAPGRIWYVVDKRQELHFTQVFRCVKKGGIVPQDTELAHLPFGTMNGSDGKPFKTRDGGVMRLDDLLDTVARAAAEKIGESAYAAGADREETARKIGIAAVKFGDLINHRTKNYVFDIDKFLAFEGKTGTYLLYTVTRINSILKKTGEDAAAPRIRAIHTPAERALYLNLILTGEAFALALREKAPSHIAENAYKLAALFSGFYHESPIAAEPDADKRADWIALCVLTRRLLKRQLDVLGIDTVESM